MPVLIACCKPCSMHPGDQTKGHTDSLASWLREQRRVDAAALESLWYPDAPRKARGGSCPMFKRPCDIAPAVCSLGRTGKRQTAGDQRVPLGSAPPVHCQSRLLLALEHAVCGHGRPAPLSLQVCSGCCSIHDQNWSHSCCAKTLVQKVTMGKIPGSMRCRGCRLQQTPARGIKSGGTRAKGFRKR